jgi:hypothetical protein
MGYFPSSDQEIRDHIPKVADSIAAQLFYWLRKHGCTLEGIKKYSQNASRWNRGKK